MIKDPVQGVISFDTTGSMMPCLAEVRRNAESTVKRLFAEIENLELAVLAHGDYCDARSTYVTKMQSFTSNPAVIIDFIRNVGPTGGGDAPECYELVLREVRTKLAWKAGTKKVFLLIGDDVPHEPSYRENTLKIDWRNELGLLLEQQIRVFGVHALASCRRHSKSFYEEIARKTGGQYLTLEQFSLAEDTILAVLYQQGGDDMLLKYEQEVKDKGRWNRHIDNTFSILLKRKPETFVATASASKFEPVPPARFQTLRVEVGADVKKKPAIKDFVLSHGLAFAKGRGFYEWTKREEIQEKKEIIAQDKVTGDMFTGAEARKLIGLPFGERGTLRPEDTPESGRYRFFIQSTSVNRALVPSTAFLYEVPDWKHTGASA